VPPLHFWFPEIVDKLNWIQCFLLFSWQKVAPLLLIAAISIPKTIATATIAVLVGALGGLNLSNVKPLIAYSSISHRGWVLTASILSLATWCNYFLIYCLLSYRIIFLLNKAPLKKISELTQWKETFINKIIFIFNILSLGGLPPFLGFVAKLSVLSLLLSTNYNLLIFIFVIASLLSLYFYLRLTYSFFIKTQSSKKTSTRLSSSSSPYTLIFCTSINVIIPLVILFI